MTAERKAPANRDINDQPPTHISGAEAANLFIQGAWRRARNNGPKMRKLLEGVLFLFYQTGGAFMANPETDCHPHVPGCNWFMAVWSKQFQAAMKAEIARIRLDITGFPKKNSGNTV